MDPRTLVRTAVPVALSAVLGSIATRAVNGRWYRSLSKPAIQPPAVVFPLVWTALYIDIAVTTARALDALGTESGSPVDSDEAAVYERALWLNLALNASWCWVFFRGHRFPAATAVALALAGSSVDLARRTYRADPQAGLALTPYAAWCSFATVLTAAFWRKNR